MASEGILIDEFMKYDSMVRQTFKSENEAYKFYLAYAKSKGFGVRKGDLKYKGNKEAVVNSQEREIQILDSLQSRNNRKDVIAAVRL